ncbi:MAG: membrane protein insertion efficiency factor YidD [Draconibacterium sp.]|nr:membrane protein insertion efficiency factor YidD [Draconibacterium sp.]
MNINIFSRYLVLIFFLCICAEYSYSQVLISGELKSLFINPDTIKTDFKEPLKKAVNEIDIVFSSGFLFYKSFVSSQDKPSCIFSPSCSEFAVEAFQKKGLFRGWLKTFDRLSRCHGFAKHTHYHFDTEKKLFYDPVK